MKKTKSKWKGEKKGMLDREILTADSEALMKIKRLLGVTQKNCCYCNIKITGKNIGGILGHPTRLICKSIVCMVEEIEEK